MDETKSFRNFWFHSTYSTVRLCKASHTDARTIFGNFAFFDFRQKSRKSLLYGIRRKCRRRRIGNRICRFKKSFLEVDWTTPSVFRKPPPCRGPVRATAIFRKSAVSFYNSLSWSRLKSPRNKKVMKWNSFFQMADDNMVTWPKYNVRSKLPKVEFTTRNYSGNSVKFRVKSIFEKIIVRF